MRFGVPYAGIRDEDCRSAINSYFCLVGGKFAGLWAAQVMTRFQTGPHFLDAPNFPRGSKVLGMKKFNLHGSITNWHMETARGAEGRH
jgi:hypothetical protein